MTRLRACLAALLLAAAASTTSADVRSLALPANDLAYDPGTHRLYASVPSSAGASGNSITAIDPVTGQIGPSVFVGSEPDKLALSDDGQYLYVGLDGAAAVRRFDLKTQTAGPQFPLGGSQAPGPSVVEDLQVMPGHPQTVAVSRLRNGVAVYDNGAPRPKMTTYGDFIDTITFGRSADRLYGFDTYTSGAALTRMAVDATGLTVLDRGALGGLGAQMKFADGRIYGSSGLVIDPDTRQAVGTFKGPNFRSSVAPDPAAGRVYFLTQPASSSTWTLLTFDPQNFLPLGTMPLPGAKGQASSLIRWGQERSDGGGLAFRTDQGQVFLLRPSVAAPAGADLALTATAMPEPVAQGANLTVVFTATNTSAAAANHVSLTASLPAPLTDTVVSLASTQGQSRQNGSQIVGDLGTLAGGARASVTVVLKPGANSSTGITAWTGIASVSADEPDPNPSNNRIEERVAVLPRGSGGAPAGSDVRQLALTTNDLAYDPVTHQIYASTPSSAGAGGNSVVSIDPVAGSIGSPVFIGSEPGKLALSDDGQFLYVALGGAAAVRRFDVMAQSAGQQFSLGADSFFGPYYVGDMAVMPGSPHTVAVARVNRGVSAAYAGVAVYDDGVPRGKMTGRQDGVDVIEFSNSPNRLYGYNNETTEFGFRRMTVDASGVTVADVAGNLISGFGVDIRYDQGLIFSTSGREIDPEARKLLGTFGGLTGNTWVAPDVKAGRVYFLVGDVGPNPATPWKLLTYDPKTFLLLDTREIPGVKGQVNSLIRWGQERADGGGLAFGTDQGQVFLINLPALAPPPPDFSLALNPSQAAGETIITATVRLSGLAPASGFPVALSSSSPAAVTVPAALTIPAGAQEASTPLAVHAVTAPTDVVITARAGGVTHTATLHLTPSTPPAPPTGTAGAQLVLFPNPVPGGLLALGQVTLAQPAGRGGLAVALSSSQPAVALLPAALTVSPGATTATFPILTFPVAATTSVTITAATAQGAATAALQLLPLTPPASPPPVATPAGVRLLVSCDTGNSILRFDGQTGAFLDPLVRPGSGGLAGPHGLALGPDGNLYVASRGGGGVLRYDGQTGAFLGTFVPPGSGGLSVPIALTFGPDGNLYVTSNGSDAVLRYDGRTGAFLGAFVAPGSRGLSQPYALAFGPDGTLYVSSEGRNSIYQFEGRTGAFLGQIVPAGSGGLQGPNGLAFGPDGNLYVSSWLTHSILRYDGVTGAFLGVFVPPLSGGLTEPWDLTFGPDGNLYVASAGSNQVLRYDGRTGAFLGPFTRGSGLARPVWLLFVPLSD